VHACPTFKEKRSRLTVDTLFNLVVESGVTYQIGNNFTYVETRPFSKIGRARELGESQKLRYGRQLGIFVASDGRI